MNFKNVGLMAAEHDVRTSFSMARPLPEAPDSMMIYETVTPGMRESEVKTLMKAFGIDGKVTDRQRQYMVREGQKVLEIFKEPGTGYLRFSNDARLGAEPKAENLPSRDEVIIIGLAPNLKSDCHGSAILILAFLRKKSYEGRAKSNQINYFHHLIPKVKVEKIEKNTIIYVKVIRVINNLKHIKKRRVK